MARSRWQATIADDAGNVVPSASIEIRDAETGNLAALTSDRAGLNNKSNPFTADSEGFGFAYVEPGRYNITASSGGFSRTWTDVPQMDEPFTDEDRAKLDGIEEGADVTNLDAITEILNALTAKSSAVDADLLALIDSAASFALKKITFSNFKAALKTYFDGIYQPLNQLGSFGTPVAASGTAVTFSGISSSAKVIFGACSGISTNGTAVMRVRIGDAGGIETSNYDGSSASFSGGTVGIFTGGFDGQIANAAAVRYGWFLLVKQNTSNRWSCFFHYGRSDAAAGEHGSGSKALSDTLTQLAITTSNGTDTFDGSGEFNIIVYG